MTDADKIVSAFIFSGSFLRRPRNLQRGQRGRRLRQYAQRQQLGYTVNMGSVSEVKVLMNNYQAEYGKGRRAWSTSSLKRQPEFHGLPTTTFARGFQRDTFSTTDQRSTGTVSFNTMGGKHRRPDTSLVLQQNKDKLFFFFAQEYAPPQSAGAPVLHGATAAERKGDFNRRSRTEARSNAASKIVDPSTRTSLFERHGFPQPHRSQYAKLLNVFHHCRTHQRVERWTLSPTGAWYNYTIQDFSTDRESSSLRVDYNISEKWHLFIRGTQRRDAQQGLEQHRNRYAGCRTPMWTTLLTQTWAVRSPGSNHRW